MSKERKMEYRELRNKLLLDIISVILVLISPATIIYIISLGHRNYNFIGIDAMFLGIGAMFFVIVPVIYGMWYFSEK